jgi:hypothetical protein
MSSRYGLLQAIKNKNAFVCTFSVLSYWIMVSSGIEEKTYLQTAHLPFSSMNPAESEVGAAHRYHCLARHRGVRVIHSKAVPQLSSLWPPHASFGSASPRKQHSVVNNNARCHCRCQAALGHPHRGAETIPNVTARAPQFFINTSTVHHFVPKVSIL